MDFVDAHAYWEHPQFPRRQWDMTDWEIPNTPMVDDPAGATLWGLAATRVAGKPFTVTEYNHPAPNDWQAECMPMIATYAALQDWDGVFLFDYVDSHKKYEKARDDRLLLPGRQPREDGLPAPGRAAVPRRPASGGGGVRDPPAPDGDPRHGFTLFREQWPSARHTRE